MYQVLDAEDIYGTCVCLCVCVGGCKLILMLEYAANTFPHSAYWSLNAYHSAEIHEAFFSCIPISFCAFTTHILPKTPTTTHWHNHHGFSKYEGEGSKSEMLILCCFFFFFFFLKI